MQIGTHFEMEITIDLVKEQKIKIFTDCIEEKLNDDEKNRFHCHIKKFNCDFGDKTNAIRHIRLRHSEIYNSIRSNKEEKSSEEDINEKFIELRVRVNIKDIWEACTDLITVNALSLSVVESPAFKKILEPYVIALKRQGIELNINKKAIKKYIEERVNEIKKQIIDETKGGLIDLMIDIATRHNRSVIGINIKYMVNGIPVIRTIGMHSLRFAHTAENIRKLIIEKLNEYELSLENVFSITTDNGANLLKTIAELNQEYQNERQNLSENSPEDRSVNDNDQSVNDSSDEEIDMEIFDEEYYIDLLSNLRLEFGDLDYSNLILGISCAAHCLHLVVTKSIAKCRAVNQLLAKVRELVKKLRTPTFRNIISNRCLNQAIIDVTTRWNSIYSMVSPLFKILFPNYGFI